MTYHEVSATVERSTTASPSLDAEEAYYEPPSMDDIRVLGYDPIIQPLELARKFPLSKKAHSSIREFRRVTRAILEGKDDRLLVVVGPCSLHDPKAALEYSCHLKKAIQTFEKDLFMVMRSYLEKPRTTIGWKGLINDPNLDGSFRINEGLQIARALLNQLAEDEIPIAIELLDTISPQYYSELITWGAVGARTTESQLHRELASGVSFPVGIKNGTDGRVQIALDAIQTASHPHHFLGVSKSGVISVTRTKGNPTCHLILRGGDKGPNYSLPHVMEAEMKLKEANLSTSIMVDCSHGNSQKQHLNQIQVAKEVANQLVEGTSPIKGVMIESFLVEGKQNWSNQLVYGQSITDACLSWEQTVPVLENLAQAIRERRKRMTS
ncbi:hypothetical protein HMI56_007713 [Coelomomyces lativittatus]|nr:hypothetical protein HMI56_007713 [Coelomomyces lativittatus]